MTNDVQNPESRIPSQRRRWWLMAGFVVGLGLLALAVWVAGREADWQKLVGGGPWRILGLLGLVVASLLINGLLFQMATRPFETTQRISFWDWQAMLAASSLLNYLPKAGLVGRIALLKHRYNIGYRSSIVILIGMAGGSVAVLLGLLGLVLWRGGLDVVGAVAFAAMVGLAALTGAPVVRGLIRRFGGKADGNRLVLWLALWIVLRAADGLCCAGRLWLAAEAFGTPLTMTKSVVLATAGMFLTMGLPIPNGMGVREWVYGELAQRAGFGGGAISVGAAMGVAVVDRAAEIIVYVVIGLASLAWLRRSRRQRTIG